MVDQFLFLFAHGGNDHPSAMQPGLKLRDQAVTGLIIHCFFSLTSSILKKHRLQRIFLR